MKTVWIILISFVVTAAIVGGGTYYFVNAQATKDKDNLQAQITTLNTKVADTEKSLADAQTVTPATTQTVADVTATWKTYNNTDYTIKYPSNWVLYNNELAGSEFWYESAAKQTAGEALISIGTAKPTTSTANQEMQSRKTAIETSNKNLTFTISTVTFGVNTFSKGIATNKTTGVIDNTQTSYVTVVGSTLVSIAPKSILASDLQNMLGTLQVK